MHLGFWSSSPSGSVFLSSLHFASGRGLPSGSDRAPPSNGSGRTTLVRFAVTSSWSPSVSDRALPSRSIRDKLLQLVSWSSAYGSDRGFISRSDRDQLRIATRGSWVHRIGFHLHADRVVMLIRDPDRSTSVWARRCIDLSRGSNHDRVGS